MSETLVPQDQPYGERQQTVAGMRQAGMPLNPARMGGVPPDMLRETAPTRVPDMSSILAPPAPPPMDTREKARAIRDLTPNATLRELLTRTLGE